MVKSAIAPYNPPFNVETNPMPPLILASSSIYRRKLLQQLDLTFSSHSPDIDESIRAGETPAQLALRLAIEKAKAIANHHHQHLIIGSDQVACLDQTILNKPGNHQRAVEQLTRCNGNTVQFYTALALLNSASGKLQSWVEPFEVTFRQLTSEQIENYLQREQPYQCAGSFMVEGLGISLFSKLNGEDPNSLIGLPLIKLVEMLANEGVNVL